MATLIEELIKDQYNIYIDTAIINYYNTFLYVFVSCITFGMLIYSIETIRNYKINRKLRDNRLIIEIEPINTENIELVIFNNN